MIKKRPDLKKRFTGFIFKIKIKKDQNRKKIDGGRAGC
jgi:hypothetical protein